MTFRRGLSVLSATTIAIGLTAACGGGAPREAQPEAPPAPAAAESPVAVIEKWRAKHDTDYRRDWVTHRRAAPARSRAKHRRQRRVERHRPARAGAAAARPFVLDETAVRFEPAADAPVLLKVSRSPAIELQTTGRQRRTSSIDRRRPSRRPRQRRDAVASRPRSERPARERASSASRGFRSICSIASSAASSATPQPKSMKVPNTFGEVDAYKTEGVVEFTLLGQTLRLRPFTTRPKRFYFVFRDASSGQRDLRDRALPLRRSARRRHDGAGFQPGVQPAVRVQPVHDVPDPASGEPAADQNPRRREGLPGPRATRRRRQAVGSDRGQTGVRPGSAHSRRECPAPLHSTALGHSPAHARRGLEYAVSAMSDRLSVAAAASS